MVDWGQQLAHVVSKYNLKKILNLWMIFIEILTPNSFVEFDHWILYCVKL